MKVWEETIRPDEDVRVLPIAEVYDLKLDKDGKPIKRKYRICAKGFMQKKGVDYFNVYAPVIDPEVMRMVFVVAAELGLIIEQFDFTAAFLTSKTDVEMYVELPPGYQLKNFDEGSRNKVILRLLKSICGMKQAAHLFWKCVSQDLRNLGFKQSKSSKCLFTKYCDGNLALLVLHVDDGAYATRHKSLISKDLALLQRKYKLSHEPLNWHVGLRIVRED